MCIWLEYRRGICVIFITLFIHNSFFNYNTSTSKNTHDSLYIIIISSKNPKIRLSHYIQHPIPFENLLFCYLEYDFVHSFMIGNERSRCGETLCVLLLTRHILVFLMMTSISTLHSTSVHRSVLFLILVQGTRTFR